MSPDNKPNPKPWTRLRTPRHERRPTTHPPSRRCSARWKRSRVKSRVAMGWWAKDRRECRPKPASKRPMGRVEEALTEVKKVLKKWSSRGVENNPDTPNAEDAFGTHKPQRSAVFLSNTSKEGNREAGKLPGWMRLESLSKTPQSRGIPSVATSRTYSCVPSHILFFSSRAIEIRKVNETTENCAFSFAVSG